MTKVKKISNKVTTDRREPSERRKDKNERRGTTATATATATAPATTTGAGERRLGERREKVNRRRQIDPTTCERDYTDAEVEFMHALDQYKRASGRMFPTCSEVLEVLRALGYEKVARRDSIHIADLVAPHIPQETAV